MILQHTIPSQQAGGGATRIGQAQPPLGTRRPHPHPRLNTSKPLRSAAPRTEQPDSSRSTSPAEATRNANRVISHPPSPRPTVSPARLRARSTPRPPQRTKHIIQHDAPTDDCTVSTGPTSETHQGRCILAHIFGAAPTEGPQYRRTAYDPTHRRRPGDTQLITRRRPRRRTPDNGLQNPGRVLLPEGDSPAAQRPRQSHPGFGSTPKNARGLRHSNSRGTSNRGKTSQPPEHTVRSTTRHTFQLNPTGTPTKHHDYTHKRPWHSSRHYSPAPTDPSPEPITSAGQLLPEHPSNLPESGSLQQPIGPRPPLLKK